MRGMKADWLYLVCTWLWTPWTGTHRERLERARLRAHSVVSGGVQGEREAWREKSGKVALRGRGERGELALKLENKNG